MALLSQPAAGNAGPAIVPPSPPADSTPATSTPGALNCSDATLGISALPAFTSPEEECQFVVQNFEGGCLANLIGIEVFANSAECNWPVCGWTRPADTVAGVCQATCAAQPVPYGPCAPARPPSPPSAPCADLALNLPLELAPAGDPTPEQECNYALNVLQWPCALPFSAILDYLNSDICELQICAWEDVPVGVTTVGEVCQASCGARGYGVCAAASPSPPPPSPPSPPPSPPSPPSPPASPPPPPAAGSVVIFPGYNLSWVVRMAEGEIEISIDALTNGWVGFGLAELGGMPGADIMVASVSDDGIAQIGDYWASGYFTPQLDESQDWTLVSASQSDSVTSVRATRRLDTNDRQDRSFDPSLPIAHRVIAAIGATDTFVYHAERAPATVDFFNTVADPLAQIKADPNISTLSYRAPDYVIPPQCSTEYGAQAPCTGGIADCIQTCYGTETTYTEFCFPVTLPNSHIVAVEPVVDPRSSRYVHHYQVDLTSATCAERSSGGDDAAEELTIYIAARETGPLALPEAAGFRVGAGTPYSSVVITIHYDNPSAATNVVDASGIDLHYTTLLRPHDAAVLQLGDPNVLLANAPMPPGLSRWDFFCPAVATAAALTQPLTAFARFQHMHKNGARIVSTQYDATFTTLRTSATEYFDFDFQSYHAQDAQQWTISPGDQIVTACYYDTGASSDVKWGLAGQNEMCVDYVYYYPAEPRLSQCGLGVNGLIIGGAVPFQGQEPIAFFNRTFGLPGAPCCKLANVRPPHHLGPISTSSRDLHAISTRSSPAPLRLDPASHRDEIFGMHKHASVERLCPLEASKLCCLAHSLRASTANEAPPQI
uniref:DOMON domain-containing protein n=1 Tax=Chrysotila carterae TaxID=13221 RepID=A0A7S4F182_CHRCT